MMNEPQRQRGTTQRKNAFLLCVLALCSLCLCSSLLFFYRLGDRDLWASHEARAAQNAQRILDDGDWLLPRLYDDQVELQKPPLYYWLAAAAGALRGKNVDALAVRLPAAVAGLATAVVVFVFFARRGRPLAGLFAALCLETAQHFTWISRTGRIDVPLTLAVTCSILCLWQARQPGSIGRSRFFWSLAGYLAMAAGLLLKGPVGAVLPLAVVTVAAAYCRQPILPRSLIWGLPLAVAVAGPWFIVAHLRTHGEFTRQFFWYHNFQRTTGGASTLAVHPWWFYGPRLAFDFLPWSPLLAVAGWVSFRCRQVETDPIAALGLTWLLTILLLLSAARFKRADYLLPAYPARRSGSAASASGCTNPAIHRAAHAGSSSASSERVR